MSSSQARRTLCHPGGFELLLFMPRERARSLRLRVVSDPRFSDVRVSRLYRAGSGWAVTLCEECRAELGQPLQTDREPRTVEFV